MLRVKSLLVLAGFSLLLTACSSTETSVPGESGTTTTEPILQTTTTEPILQTTTLPEVSITFEQYQPTEEDEKENQTLEDREREANENEPPPVSATPLTPCEQVAPQVGSVLVYFPCGNTMADAASFLRQLPEGQDPLSYAFEQLVAGPTEVERAQEAFRLVLFDAWPDFAVFKEGPVVVIDFVGTPVLIQNLLAFHSITTAIMRTGQQFSGQAEIRINGTPLYDFAELDQ